MARLNLFFSFFLLLAVSGCGIEAFQTVQTDQTPGGDTRIPDLEVPGQCLDKDGPCFRPDTDVDVCVLQYRQCLEDATGPDSYYDGNVSYNDVRDEADEIEECRRELRQCQNRPELSTDR